MSIAADLLARIEKFCKDHDMTERAFGIKVANNHKFVSRLRAGHAIYSDTIDRANALIAGKKMPPTTRERTVEQRPADASRAA